MKVNNQGEYEIAQMEEVTFWTGWDSHWNGRLIAGYEVKYEQIQGGSTPYYKHLAPHGRGRGALQAHTFKFEKGEYIICLWARTGGAVDNIEFQTNKMRYFDAGCTGGTFRQFTTVCGANQHPRILAFGCTHGPYDVT